MILILFDAEDIVEFVWQGYKMVSLTGRVSTFFKNNLLLYLLLLLQHSSKFWKKLDTKFRIGRDHVSRKLITVCSRLYDLPKETKLCANIFLRQKNLVFGRFKFKQYRYFQKIIVNNNIILPLLYYQFTNYLQVTWLIAVEQKNANKHI